MENVLHNITISQLMDVFADTPGVGIDDDFYIAEVDISAKFQPLSYSCRLDCYMAIYCLEGHIRLNINLDEYELKGGMLLLNSPGNVLRINNFVCSQKSPHRYLCVMMSKEFVSNLMLDVNKIITSNQAYVKYPTLELHEVDKDVLREHMSLMMTMVQSESPLKIGSVRSILSSAVYYIAGIWSGVERSSAEEEPKHPVRSKSLAEQFIKLVTEFHTHYRNVGFYADKLSLTPKYLSRVVRDVTGKSAPEWIDSYVILEAKNLLKFSGLPIKEIVSRLNFPNQSVFYKFFKARTGMTPSEYRNS